MTLKELFFSVFNLFSLTFNEWWFHWFDSSVHTQAAFCQLPCYRPLYSLQKRMHGHKNQLLPESLHSRLRLSPSFFLYKEPSTCHGQGDTSSCRIERKQERCKMDRVTLESALHGTKMQETIVS